MLNGEQPRVIMEAMRLSDLKLTMKLYTDAANCRSERHRRGCMEQGGKVWGGEISVNALRASTERGRKFTRIYHKRLNN